MPFETVSFTPTVTSPSSAVRGVVDAITLEHKAMSATVGADGGVQVAAVYDVLRPVMDRLEFATSTQSTFTPSALRGLAPERHVALSVHGGRAHTNNEVLLSVLAAAAHPGVDWLVSVVPERYKNGPTLTRVHDQLRELRDASGIDLDLVGVTLVGFSTTTRT
ncbi:hypothetical protein GCM10023221_27310 [Luteimicrobium xylanilyticum]|uniref:Uncharacterized protein n=1 Tax=Luteimicrobium xylanilyticum TaxID=1133546 RepID=A0A5P9QBA5_9MICO|nr:hypothetical protein [Luteimicrobium xylanilyticum]QFU98516.1 hypothetical protein KDY119_02032 [Luteimicrobium xylanilyticum]